MFSLLLFLFLILLLSFLEIILIIAGAFVCNIPIWSEYLDVLIFAFVICSFFLALIIIASLEYIHIQWKREIASIKSGKINKNARYRLNNYFIIKKKRKCARLYMDVAIDEQLRNLYFYRIGKSAKKNFSDALKDLQYQLPIWFEKCADDIYIHTNHIVLKRIKEAEETGILKIKSISEVRSEIQLAEHLSIHNTKIKRMKMYNVVISPPEKK